MESLDPRISRLNINTDEFSGGPQQDMEQLPTFEVFLQKKGNMPFEHVGIVHAPDEQLALVLAKEQFSRRSTCVGMMVTYTGNVVVSPYTDAEADVYEQIDMAAHETDQENTTVENFWLFHLTRRGKQHKHAGIITAKNIERAFKIARGSFKEVKPVLNVWLVREKHLIKVAAEDVDIWHSLPEKHHRNVTSYRAKQKLDHLKSESQ